MGATKAFSRKSLTLSTPLLLAASISIISKLLSSMSYDKPVILCANIRATDVLPVPRGPVNK